MHIPFYKYQGTGNDFIVIDNRLLHFDKNDTKAIQRFCDRKFGIGADGLILLEDCNDTDFRMVYFNADGKEGSMCGNGARCAVAFAHFLGLIKKTTVFMAIDGKHNAVVKENTVQLHMQDVFNIEKFPNYVFLNTGSPHHVQRVERLEDVDVKTTGRKLRYGKYGKTGSNINFVAKHSETVFSVRTYERGVEDETLSCGTGVTAVALAMHYTGETHSETITLQTLGGRLTVSFDASETGYKNICLEGPAVQVFKGEIQ